MANSGARVLVSEAKYLERVEAIREGLPDLQTIYARGESTPGESTPGESTPGESTAGDSTPGATACESFADLYSQNSADTDIRL